jgi:hypothetical protein
MLGALSPSASIAPHRKRTIAVRAIAVDERAIVNACTSGRSSGSTAS